MWTGRTRRTRLIGTLLVALLAATTACQVVEKSTDRPVTRVLIVGDSVIAFAHPALEQQFGAYGVDVENWTLLGTGPLFTWDGQKVWATKLEEKLQTYDADIVLFESCCHYPGGPAGSPLYVNDQGITVQPGTELMYTELAKANTELVEIARAHGASPYWVRLPPTTAGSIIYGPDIAERVDRFNLLLDQLDAPILDWGAAVLAQPNATSLRHPDGIHYTDAGNAFLARWTFTQTVRVVAPGT